MRHTEAHRHTQTYNGLSEVARVYLQLPVLSKPLPVLIDMKKSANTTEMIAISFITC